MEEFAFVFILSKEFCVANQTTNIDNEKLANETINKKMEKELKINVWYRGPNLIDTRDG